MTKFKAGDKVRLVGKGYNTWGLEGQTGEIRDGGENATVYISSERLELNVCPGWEVELVEEPSESGEKAKFEDVQVGDRVRLTAANGDVVEFTAVLASADWMDSVTNSYSVNDWEKVEILSRAKEPLVPGLYENRNNDKFIVIQPDGRAFFTCHEGAWIAVEEESVRRHLEDWGEQWTRRIDL